MNRSSRLATRPDTSLWRPVREIGRIVAYLSVPASTLSAAAGVLATVNVLTTFYVVAILGLLGVFRGARVQPSLVPISYFLLAWYCVLTGIELIHGGPFHFPLPRNVNYLTNYFPLVALPFFVIGLQEVRAEVRVFERVMMLTVLFSAGLCLYQFFVQGDLRPRGFSLNPIPFALITLMWSLFLLSRALQSERIDWLRFAVGLVGLVPILLAASKLVWICAALGYIALFGVWAISGRRWVILTTVAVGVLPTVGLLWQIDVLRARITEFSGDLGAYLASGNTSGPSFGLRLGAMISGFHAFLDRPFLGYGLAEARVAALDHRPPSINSFAQLPHLHSDYITHLVAFGFLGLLFIVSFFATFIVASHRRDDIAVRHFGIVSGALFLVYMAAEVVFSMPELCGLAFLLFGLILSTPERQDSRPGRLSRLLLRWPRSPVESRP